MGRTSKFTFPVPDKRPKSNMPPIISPPMSKVQRILGNAEINIESPASWDAVSASGISVSVSEHESTASSRHDDGPSRWEVESETVPAHLQHSATRQTRMGVPGEGNAMHDAVSDASPISRPRSNSTLKSWYDKSRVPLSISQQTSSSAMAKGVPSKASRLLDVDGASSNGPRPPKPASTNTSTKKKRPSRLDFTSFISGHRHHRESRTVDRPAESSLSRNQMNTHSLPSPDQRRSLRRLVQKPSRERLAERPGQDRNPNPHNRPRTGATQMHGILNATSHGPDSPQDLYNHYEEAAFRQVAELPGDDIPATIDEESVYDPWQKPAHEAIPVHPDSQSGSWSTPLRSPSQRDHHRFSNNTHATNIPHSNPVIREPHHDDRRDSKMSYPGTSNQSASAAGSIVSRSRQYKGNGWDNDYASSLTSVSSRHTKTSRASKHTNQSLPDSDRHERSVLSLSSDSEGEPDDEQELDRVVETPSKSARSVSSIGQQSRDFFGGDRKSKCASYASNSTYLTIPSIHSNTNDSSSDSPSPRRTTATTTSTTAPKPASYHGGHAQNFSAPRPGPRSSSRMSTRSAAASTTASTPTTTRIMEELEHPSPSSSHFSHAGPESDVIPESDQVENSSSLRHSNPRFMAVTRQEQMLLAALRSKRAMMREHNHPYPEAAAELEGPPLPEEMLYAHRHTPSQATIRGPAAGDGRQHQNSSPSPSQFSPLRHQGSGTSTGTVKLGSRTTTRQQGDSNRSSSRLSSRSAETMTQQQKAATAGRPSPGLGDFAFEHLDEEDAESDDSDGFEYSHGDRAATQVLDDRDARRGSASSGPNKTTPRMSGPPPGPPPATLPDPPPRAKKGVSRESKPRKGHGIPRPDSPISAACFPIPPTSTPVSRAASVGGKLVPADTVRRKAVRLSAVGGAGPEVGWWGDDG